MGVVVDFREIPEENRKTEIIEEFVEAPELQGNLGRNVAGTQIPASREPFSPRSRRRPEAVVARLETIKADDSAAERLLQRVFHFVARDAFEARRIVRAALARHDIDPQYFAALFHSDVPGQDVHFSLLTQHIMRVKADAQEATQ